MDIETLSPTLRSRVLKWRWSVFLSMFVGWSCHTLVRRTLPSATSSLIQHQGFSRDEIGMIASCFASAYGVSKFLGAIISDHASPGKVFSCGLLLGGFCCIIFPNASVIPLACAVWFVEGIVQGLGWPPCVVLLKSWYPQSQIGRWWSILSSAGNITGALIPFIVLYFTSLVNWSFSFYFFGIVSLLTGMAVLLSIKDSPTEVLKLASETDRNSEKADDKVYAEISGSATMAENATKSNKGTLDDKDVGGTGSATTVKDTRVDASSQKWYAAFFVPNLWVVSLVYAILYLVNSSSQNWSQLYFVQVVGMSEASAATCYSMFQVGAIVGNFMAGFISDLLVTPRTLKSPCPRAPFLLGVALLLAVFVHLWRTTVLEGTSEMWASCVMFGIGFLAYSGVAVVGLCAMDVVEPHMVGSAHGLACAVAQVGSFVAGWPFSHIVENSSWNTAYLIVELMLVVVVMLCLYLVLLLLSHMRKEKQE